MQNDATKKANKPNETDRTVDKPEDLAEKPISARDEQSVKGGRARADELPKE